MNLGVVLVILIRVYAGVEPLDAIDARVAAELVRVKNAQRAADESHRRHLRAMAKGAPYARFVPTQVPPFDFTAVPLTGEYVEACLGFSDRKRAGTGPDQISVEWILANRPGGFESILEWTATHGTQAAVPHTPVGRLVSLQQALELSLVDPSPGWTTAVAASQAARAMNAAERWQLFERLRSFDEQKPGSLLWEMLNFDEKLACQHTTMLLEKKETRGIARGVSAWCNRF